MARVSWMRTGPRALAGAMTWLKNAPRAALVGLDYENECLRMAMQIEREYSATTNSNSNAVRTGRRYSGHRRKSVSCPKKVL